VLVEPQLHGRHGLLASPQLALEPHDLLPVLIPLVLRVLQELLGLVLLIVQLAQPAFSHHRIALALAREAFIRLLDAALRLLANARELGGRARELILQSRNKAFGVPPVLLMDHARLPLRVLPAAVVCLANGELIFPLPRVADVPKTLRVPLERRRGRVHPELAGLRRTDIGAVLLKHEHAQRVRKPEGDHSRRRRSR